MSRENGQRVLPLCTADTAVAHRNNVLIIGGGTSVPAPEGEIPAEPILIDDITVADVSQDEDLVEMEIVDEVIVLESEPPPVPQREVVLIGAGHAHLQIVQWWRKQPLPGVRMTLVSAFDRAAYSGMLAGVMAGQFEPDEMLIDLPKLCARSNVELIVDRAIRLNPTTRQIELAHQPTRTFNVASINIGSVPGNESLWQSHRMLLSIKPIATFWQRFQMRQQELLAQWRDAQLPKRLQLAIVGAGTAGLELALCLEERIHNEDLPFEVHLVDGAKEIWPTASPRAIHRARKLLESRGIDVHLGQRIVGCDEEGRNALILDDGSRLRCDLAIWTTTTAPPSVLKGFLLPQSDRGFLLVDRTLRASTDPPVFAVGDAADFPIPAVKTVADSVRQGPVLWHNLCEVLSGQPLKAYDLQPDGVTLLACGDGTAIFDCRGWVFRSQWAWWWKHRSDRAFVRRFR